MIPAPTLNDVLDHRRRNDRALCCILLAPTFSKVGKDEIANKIGYLNYRSGSYVDFYCGGYGGYWHPSFVPDMEEICKIHYQDGTVIPWAFSQTEFAKFVEELEQYTSWNYSGESEILVLDHSVDFSSVLRFDIERMISDKAIHKSSDLFEAIMKFARDAKDAADPYDLSDQKGIKEFGKAAETGILSLLPKPLEQLWTRGKHYAVRNLEKK